MPARTAPRREPGPCRYETSLDSSPFTRAAYLPMKARRRHTLTQLGSQATKEIQHMLLVDFSEPEELSDDLIRFRRWIDSVATACMGLNGFEQILRAAIVQEEDSLPKAPQGCRTELVSTGAALAHIIGQARSHVMEHEIGE